MKKIFTLIAAVLLCGTNAMADTKLVGTEDNSNNFWQGELSEIYDIAPNKTLTLEFESHTAGSEGWARHMTWVAQWWDLQEKNVFMRGDGFGWQAEGDNTNKEGATWFDINSNNFPAADADFRALMEGAKVVFEFKRIGADIILTQTITNGENTVSSKFAMAFGDGTRNIALQLATEKAHIIIDNEKTAFTDTDIPTLQGTLAGKLSKTGRFGTGARTDFDILPNATKTIHFINYSSKELNWHNWILEIQNESSYLDLRCDNFGWGAYYNAANLSIKDYPWETFTEEMDGVDVVMTIVRDAAGKVDINAIHTAKSGKVFTESYTFTDAAIAEKTIVGRLLTECAYLDILPESDPTAIQTVKAANSAAASVRYNLAGQQVDAAYKGVVIENGKKMLVK